jgi:hypothetical protein
LATKFSLKISKNTKPLFQKKYQAKLRINGSNSPNTEAKTDLILANLNTPIATSIRGKKKTPLA